MSVSDFISLLGGVALFLFGMSIMGDALKKVAGNQLELARPSRGFCWGPASRR